MKNNNALTAVVVLNYNNAAATRNCIESIKKYNTAKVKFVVIDNASREDEYKALRDMMHDEFGSDCPIYDKDHTPSSEILPEAVLIRSDENLGYARGNNLGLEYIYKDPEVTHLLIINNDILFVQDLIPEFLSAKAGLPESAIITPLLLRKDGKGIDYNCARRQIRFSEIIAKHFTFYLGRIFKKKSSVDSDRYLISNLSDTDTPQAIQLPSGSCMFIEKHFFQSIESFDPNTFLYQEENILYEKIKHTGKINYLLPYLKCIHLGSETISEVPNQVKIMKVAMESEEYFVMTYLNPNIFQKCLYKFSKTFFLCTFRIQKFLFHKK